MNLRKTIIGALGALALAFGMVGAAEASTVTGATGTADISVNGVLNADITAVGDVLFFEEKDILDGKTLATVFNFTNSGVPVGSVSAVVVTVISGLSTLKNLTFDFNMGDMFLITDSSGNTLPAANDGFLVSLLGGANTIKVTGTTSGAGAGSSLYSASLLATPIPAAGLLFGSALLIGGLYRRRKMVKEFGLPS